MVEESTGGSKFGYILQLRPHDAADDVEWVEIVPTERGSLWAWLHIRPSEGIIEGAWRAGQFVGVSKAERRDIALLKEGNLDVRLLVVPIYDFYDWNEGVKAIEVCGQKSSAVPALPTGHWSMKCRQNPDLGWSLF